MNNREKTLVVLAAGMGSRYGGLKQIDPVGPHGERVIDYSVFDARRAGFGKVVFVIRRDMEQAFREGVGAAMEERMEVGYAFQSIDDIPAPYHVPVGREKPWGTGHAVYAAREVVTGPFAVINADDFYGRRAFELLAGHLDNAAGREAAGTPEYAMVAYELQKTVSAHGTVSRGLCRLDDEGRLVDIEEVTAIEVGPDGIVSREADGRTVPRDGAVPVSMNCWGFFPSLFEALETDFVRFLQLHGGGLKSEFYLPGSVSDLIAERRAEVRVLASTDAWFGVTYREDKPAVMAGIQALVDRGAYPSPLWE